MPVNKDSKKARRFPTSSSSVEGVVDGTTTPTTTVTSRKGNNRHGKRSASATTNKKTRDGSYSNNTSAKDPQDSAVSSSSSLVVTGAVAVRGGGPDRDDDDDEDYGGEDEEAQGGDDLEGSSSPRQQPRANNAAAIIEAPIVVDSYVVDDDDETPAATTERIPNDDEIRRRILAGTVHAEEIPMDDQIKVEQERQRRRSRVWIVVSSIVAVAVAVATAVGIAVPLSRRNQSSSDADSTSARDPNVVASIRYVEWQGSGGFAYSVQAETRTTLVLGDETLTTNGVVEIVACKPTVCTVSDEACAVGTYYEPGCCAGANCTNATKCGDSCPPSPTSCYLTDPTNRTCLQPDCYTCHKVNGHDAYVLNNIAFAIDCLQVGTSIRPDNNETYQWAIFCGPMIAGPVVEQNRGLGQYQCGAFRRGANYSDDVGGAGMEAANYPCVYLALAECGCGPSDMYTFGLPTPTGPCEPPGSGGNRTCPILCEDVGAKYASNLCRSFPGNISYWDGHNAFNSTLFYEGLMAPNYELDMYIKGSASAN